MAYCVLTHEISKRRHRFSPVCLRSTPSIGHTRLHQQLKGQKQNTFASPFKNTVEKKKECKKKGNCKDFCVTHKRNKNLRQKAFCF